MEERRGEEGRNKEKSSMGGTERRGRLRRKQKRDEVIENRKGTTTSRETKEREMRGQMKKPR